MGLISNTAIVSGKAEIGNNVTIRDFAVVEDDVVIGDNTVIDYSALIKNGTRLGKDCKIYKGAVIASDPMDIKYKGESTICEIGDNTIVREHTTISKGTHLTGKTTVGSDCYIMTYCHIAHDNRIGNNVTIVNSVGLGGCVTIDDWAYISGLVGIHQFVKVGCHSLISINSKVTQDIPPYVIADGNPLSFRNLNLVGLNRRGFSKEAISNIKNAYNLIYYSPYNISDAVKAIKDTMTLTEEVSKIIDFIEASRRGILRARK